MFDNFKAQQIWQQIVHLTDPLNNKLIAKLESLTQDETFIDQITQIYEQAPPVSEDGQPSEVSDQMEEEGENELMEEGEDDMSNDFDYGMRVP